MVAMVAALIGFTAALAQTPSFPESAPSDTHVKLEERCLRRLMAETWTLTHAYDSKEEVDKVLTYFATVATTHQRGDSNQIRQLGGADGIKKQFSKFLESRDNAVRAFSALFLACTGDRSYAPKLAAIVNERDASFTDRFAPEPSFVRGRAAIALGMLRAVEYKPDIAKLLKSKNDSDRSGAIAALTEMQAVEFTKEIVSLLTDKDIAFDDDDSPIYFLIETKQARKYKNVLVQALFAETRSKIPESAAYPLAALDAKEHARDVARLLKNEFRQRHAAKALALMGAVEYSDEIAKLLASKSGLTRNAAIVSLSILDSKKHISAIEKIYQNDPEGYVKAEAATALLLLGKPQYYRERAGESNGPPKLSEIDFHYFVIEKLKPYNEKLFSNLNSVPPNP